MLKRSTSRNQRSRGVRMKHVLQIVVLLGICFWLIYQVKYSHDRRRELSGKDAERSNTEQVSDFVKLGRKDLKPRLEETDGKNEKHDEEEEDKHEEGEEEREEELTKPEDDRSEETKKHEEAEGQEGEEKDYEVKEEEETKGDEFEDQGKPHDEVDQEEDFIDEEKEREDESSEDKETAEDNEEEEEEEKQGLVEDENQNLAEDEAHDEVDRSTHEAREEHYKGDDASSAVTHDNDQLIGSGMEKFDLDFVNESKVTNNTSNQFNDEEENGSESDGKEIEMADKVLNSKETGAEKKDNENETDDAKVVEDSPPQNSSVSTENNGAKLTSTEMNTENVATSPPNGAETVLNSAQVQNSTVNGGGINSDTVSDGKGADPALASPNAGAGESSNSTTTDLGLVVSDQKLSSDEKDAGGGNIRLPSTMKENNENDTQNQELEERQNESSKVKTG